MIVLFRRLLDELRDVTEGRELRQAGQRVSEAVGILQCEAKLIRSLAGINLLDHLNIRKVRGQDEGEKALDAETLEI